MEAPRRLQRLAGERSYALPYGTFSRAIGWRVPPQVELILRERRARQQGPSCAGKRGTAAQSARATPVTVQRQW
jgi:hypothetical protein